ncbi:MAG: V-type ATPase subunit [Candidatus Thalassarchaeaceae archaeon]|jgi:V/A-type H+-transporting ATPase subunit C|nr:V-type ATPase subunit [Candidatus Thalassarchaeaceae archaeon]
MATVSRGKSNWANASARSKARKANLIDATQMRQLLLQEPDAMASSIAEMGYRAELDLYAIRLSGADLVEAALNHNMDRDLIQVLGFCQGHLKDLVSIYVERYTYQKVKTALRAIRSGVSDEMVASQVLAEENDANSQWLEVVRNSNTLSDAVSALTGTKFGKAVLSVEDSNDLMALEDALDRQYYHDATGKLRAGGSSHPQLLRYLRTEIDHRNVANLFRALKQSLSSEERHKLMLQGGYALNPTILRQAAEADNEEALVEILRRAPNFNDSGFDEALAASREKGTLDPIVNILTEQRMLLLNRMATLHPLSAFPVINYVERKVCEVTNLRLMTRGRAAGLSDEVIEAHLRI